jgi:hypothetical protein
MIRGRGGDEPQGVFKFAARVNSSKLPHTQLLLLATSLGRRFPPPLVHPRTYAQRRDLSSPALCRSQSPNAMIAY